MFRFTVVDEQFLPYILRLFFFAGDYQSRVLFSI